MQQISNLKLLLAGLTTVLISLIAMLSLQGAPTPPGNVFGGVTVGNEYNSTTTAAIAIKPKIIYLTGTTTQKTGSLGSIIQTAAGTAGTNIDLYDATTTSVLLRSTSMATSSILLASLPNNAAAGTYIFDLVYKVGLIAVIETGSGTTTITWR